VVRTDDRSSWDFIPLVTLCLLSPQILVPFLLYFVSFTFIHLPHLKSKQDVE